MTTKKPAKKAPAKRRGKSAEPKAMQAEAQSGRVHQAMPGSLIEGATPGNREGLARAFGHAGAWLREGRAPPKELAEWLAECLLRLSAVLRDRHDKKLSGVNAALGLVESGKRGRKPASLLDDAKRRDLVLDVQWQRARFGGNLTEAFDRVVAFHAVAGHWITPVQVAAAWKDRKKLIPEMDS